MGLKRKRDELDDSPASTTSTTSTSTLAPSSPSPVPTGFWSSQISANPNTWTDLRQTNASPSEPFFEPSRPMLNSRTRKRWRDNRPDEESVHENTLQKLFGAQRRIHDVPSQPHTSVSASWQPAAPEQERNQTSLHAFWNLPVPAPSLANIGDIMERDVQGAEVERCEDCHGFVDNSDLMDLDDMEVDALSRAACRSCGKRVCGNCVFGTEGRMCLRCA